ncbi:MAG: toprim domain-containing protein [Alphaproteobacteria bacterium]|nr:toprim domain-containing protein [Alphaproteobacteria bacterium]
MSSVQCELFKNAVEGFKSLKTIALAMDNDQGGDHLADKITAILAETSFQGIVRRHSPDRVGQDWNSILTKGQN